MERRSVVPVGHRNPGISRHCNRGRNSRYHFKINSFFCKKLQFLSSPSEHKRIPALQPQHILPFFCLPHKNPVDLLLGHRMISGMFSHINRLCCLGDMAEYLSTDQSIIDDDIRCPHELRCPNCEKARISRPRSGNPHLSHDTIFFLVFHFTHHPVILFLFISHAVLCQLPRQVLRRALYSPDL